jgi:hypothetical protein
MVTHCAGTVLPFDARTRRQGVGAENGLRRGVA